MSRQVNKYTTPITRIDLEGFEELKIALNRIAFNATPIIASTWRDDIRKSYRPALRRRVKRAFKGKKKLASSYSIRVLTEKRNRNVIMDFYSRMDMSIPHEYGETIRPKTSKYLALPTKHAKKKTRFVNRRSQKVMTRWGRGKSRYFRGTFVRRMRGGQLIVYQMQTTENERSYPGARKLRGKKFKQKPIPLFVLRRSVRIPARTGVRKFANDITPRIVASTLGSITNAYMREPKVKTNG